MTSKCPWHPDVMCQCPVYVAPSNEAYLDARPATRGDIKALRQELSAIRALLTRPVYTPEPAK